MDLTAKINEAIANQPPDELRRYIGASSIGRPCSREIWYAFSGIVGEKHPAQLKKTFDVGSQLEKLIISYVRLAGFMVAEPSHENNYLFVDDKEVPIFQGHLDGILLMNNELPVILEIKTAKNSSFQKFQKHGLRLWSDAYWAQIHSYMGMSGYKQAVLLAMNKDTSELHHEWVDFDLAFYKELRMKALAISAIGEPPERINRSAYYYLCQNCQYKGICHE